MSLKSFYFKIFSVILIASVGIVVYSNSFNCSFHFDDGTSITDNYAIKNIHDLPSIWNFWPCRFITYLSIAFNYHCNGLNVFGYHLFNLIVHIISSILVWWLTLLTLSTPAIIGSTSITKSVSKKSSQKVLSDEIFQHSEIISLFAGLIFVSHPIQTQAVTYIIQRASSMAAMFYLASLCFYVKARLQSVGAISNRPYIFSVILAILAMYTKEMTITLPLMIIFYDFCFFKNNKIFNFNRERAVTKSAPTMVFFFTLLIIPLTMFFTQSVDFYDMRRSAEDLPGISSWHYLLTQFRVMCTYIRLLVLPINQNLDYDYSISKSFFELPVLFSLSLLVIILFFAKRLFSKYCLISFAIIWFFLTLLPESSLIPIKDVIFEHRLYLTMAGYSIFLATGAYYLVGRKNYAGMVAVLTMIVGFNAFLAYERNKVWENEFTLSNDIIAKSPHKARTYSNRGSAYGRQGNLTQAMSDFNMALKLNPQFADAYYKRGIVYDKEGDMPRAILDYDKAIEFNPVYADAYNSRAIIYVKEGRMAQAISDFDKAIDLKINSADVFINRGVIYYNEGNFAQALADYNQSIQLNPQYAQAYNNRGVVEGRQGNLTQAILDYSSAIYINPNYADAYDNRASAYLKLNEYDKARADVLREKELGSSVDPELLRALERIKGS